MRTTKSQTKYWEDRSIDWEKEYFKTWDHPHRFIITAILKGMDWYSLMEIGVGGGANLANIINYIPNKRLGGIDVNEKAIELCQKKFKSGYFKVGSAEDIMMSDKSTDVLLSDMTYIYVGPFKIKKCIEELRRVARSEVLLCEFYEPNFFKRIWLYLKEGYFFYNWPKLLQKYGFYDIMVVPMPEKAWEGGLQSKYNFIIKAEVPKRYV